MCIHCVSLCNNIFTMDQQVWLVHLQNPDCCLALVILPQVINNSFSPLPWIYETDSIHELSAASGGLIVNQQCK
jgi:hypothetical protein